MAILIAFYSRAGENYFGGTYRRVAAGNTEKAAEMLSRLARTCYKGHEGPLPRRRRRVRDAGEVRFQRRRPS